MWHHNPVRFWVDLAQLLLCVGGGQSKSSPIYWEIIFSQRNCMFVLGAFVYLVSQKGSQLECSSHQQALVIPALLYNQHQTGLGQSYLCC